MRRVDLEVVHLFWDELNKAKLAAHGILPEKIDEVFDNEPEFFVNFPGRSAEYLMIGPDLRGYFYYAPMVPWEEEQGEWYVITAHRIEEKRARRYYAGRRSADDA